MSAENILDAIDKALDSLPPPEQAEERNDLHGSGFRAATLAKVLDEVGRLKLDKPTRARVDELLAKIDEARRESAKWGDYEAVRRFKRQPDEALKALRDGKPAPGQLRTKTDFLVEAKLMRRALSKHVTDLQRELATLLRDHIAELSTRCDKLAAEVEAEERGIAQRFCVAVPAGVSQVVRRVAKHFEEMAKRPAVEPAAVKNLL